MAKKTTSKLFPSDEVKKEEPVVDLDLEISAIRKKRVRINGDDNRIIELNISDLNVVNRLDKAYKKLTSLMDDVSSTMAEDTDDSDAVMDALDKIDVEMKKQIDYIFDSPVSEKCADGGSMWDPLDGAFRYEHVIEVLLGLYENNLTSEFDKMRKRVDSKLQDHKKAVSKYHK